jgi:hypothetical protein
MTFTFATFKIKNQSTCKKFTFEHLNMYYTCVHTHTYHFFLVLRISLLQFSSASVSIQDIFQILPVEFQTLLRTKSSINTNRTVIHILWGERQDLIIHHKRCTILHYDPVDLVDLVDPASPASPVSPASPASLASLFVSPLSPLLSPLLLGPILEIGLDEKDDLVLNC